MLIKDRKSRGVFMNGTKRMEQYVKKILIVEDDLSLRPLWEKFLKFKMNNISMEWAVSGEEALKMITQQNENKTPYFLIIADIFLAGSKTGMELITSDEVAKSGARTILVSAADRDEILKKFGYLVSDAIVLSKPLDFKKYEPIFRKILNGDNALDRLASRLV